MKTLSLSHSVDAVDLAYALAGFSDEEAERFGAELVNALEQQGGVLIASYFANGVADAQRKFVEEQAGIANADGRK